MRQGTRVLSGRSLGRLGFYAQLYHVARRQWVVSQLFHPIEDCKLVRQDRGHVHMTSALKGELLRGVLYLVQTRGRGQKSNILQTYIMVVPLCSIGDLILLSPPSLAQHRCDYIGIRHGYRLTL